MIGQVLLALLICAAPPGAASGTDPAALPDGTWDESQVGAVLERTLRLRLDPDLSGLGPAERAAVDKLLEAGGVMQRIHERSLHHQAIESRRRLSSLHDRMGGSAITRDLLDLFRLFDGPIATTLQNERLPFLPVDGEVPGRNVYPWGVSREEIDAYLEGHPAERDAILHPRTVVRRASREELRADLESLGRHPVLDTLHVGLRERLEKLSSGPVGFYAVPYGLAYADDLVTAHRLLQEASAILSHEDPDLASYLGNRGRDLLTGDYESGDASWVTGRFRRLNAQIGSYETYDDQLYGVKTFFGLSLMMRDEAASCRLASAIAGLQAIEDSLPYRDHKKVRPEIPVGVYDVIADFGQARGTNTATILPNESRTVRKYGRTILIRGNIIRHPDLFEISRASFAAAVLPEHARDLTPEGSFQYTLWHEIGHYLGPDRTTDGRELGAALTRFSDLYEEMKSDLVSLHAAPILKAGGHLDEDELRSFLAAGILRVLQRVKPRREQPYQTMQLMQMNYYLERGLLVFRDGQLAIDYALYPSVVDSLLEEVLAIQQAGDPARAGEFVERYGTWEEEVQGRLAARIDGAAPYRFRLVRYTALGE